MISIEQKSLTTQDIDARTRHQSPPHRPKIVAVGSRFLPPRSFRQNSAEGRLDERNQKEVSGAA